VCTQNSTRFSRTGKHFQHILRNGFESLGYELLDKAEEKYHTRTINFIGSNIRTRIYIKKSNPEKNTLKTYTFNKIKNGIVLYIKYNDLNLFFVNIYLSNTTNFKEFVKNISEIIYPPQTNLKDKFNLFICSNLDLEQQNYNNIIIFIKILKIS